MEMAEAEHPAKRIKSFKQLTYRERYDLELKWKQDKYKAQLRPYVQACMIPPLVEIVLDYTDPVTYDIEMQWPGGGMANGELDTESFQEMLSAYGGPRDGQIHLCKYPRNCCPDPYVSTVQVHPDSNLFLETKYMCLLDHRLFLIVYKERYPGWEVGSKSYVPK